MKWQHIALLFILSALIFAPYFFRSDIVGADSYNFLNYMCKEEYHYFKEKEKQRSLDAFLALDVSFFFEDRYPSEPPLVLLVINLIPCNIVIIKLILFCLFFISLLSIAFLGELFDKEQGWKVGIFVFLTPLLTWEFLKFENDSFAFPLLLWSMYFFIKGKMEKGHKGRLINHGIAIALVWAASTFWAGSLYYFVAYAIDSIIAFIIAVPVLIFLGRKLLLHAMPNVAIFENTPFLAAFYLLIPLWFISYVNLIFLPQLAFFLILAMVNAKFSLHVLPLLSICVLRAYLNKDLSKSKVWRKLMSLLMILSIAIGIWGGVNILRLPPTAEQWQVIDRGIEISQEEGLEFYNSWELGYWVQWKDQAASHSTGPSELDFNTYHDAIVITHLDTNHCAKIEEYVNYKIYRCD